MFFLTIFILTFFFAVKILNNKKNIIFIFYFFGFENKASNEIQSLSSSYMTLISTPTKLSQAFHRKICSQELKLSILIEI